MSGDCPLKGDVIEVKPGQLYQSIEQDAAAGTMTICLWNKTEDTKFTATYEFQELKIDAVLGDTSKESDSMVKSVLMPGETKQVIRGSWRALRRKLAFGPPDKAWREARAAEKGSSIVAETKKVAEIAAKANLPASLTPVERAERIAALCVAKKVPFVDLTFPPEQASLDGGEPGMPKYPWMRPQVYIKDGTKACLFEGEIEPNDIDQGNLGDCYFMCALACLSEFPELIRDTYDLPQVPALGVYRAWMCKDGWWTRFVVDDALPVSTTSSMPVFAKNREEPNELWVSLLEKAYAKIHGSYAAIRSGDPAMAIADMVGGPFDRFKHRPEWHSGFNDMFDFLERCDEEDHLMCLSTPGADTSSYAVSGDAAAEAKALAEKYEAVGLCTGHAFSLIRVKKTSTGERLCMIRNPWGNGKEWNGDWSDDSSKWTDELKKEVGWYGGDDGTFWMAWDDVRKWFDAGSVTYRVGPLVGWSQVRIRNSFVKGVPQLIVKLEVSGVKPVRARFGAHQPDLRIAANKKERTKYGGLLLSIMRPKESGTGSVKAAENGKGVFMQTRDVFAECELEPTDGRAYYIVTQNYQDWDFYFTTSAFFSDGSRVKVTYLQYDSSNEATKAIINPVTKFDEAMLKSAPITAEYQKRTPKIPKVAESKGTECDWNLPAVEEAEVKVEEPAPKPASPKPEPPKPEPPAPKPDSPRVIQKEKPPKHVDPNGIVISGLLEKFATGKSSGLKSMLPGAMTQNWKKRHFVLRNNGLLEYWDENGPTPDGEPKGVLDLNDKEKHTPTLIHRAGKMHHPSADEGRADFIIRFDAPKDSWALLLRADNPGTRNHWLSALSQFCR